MSYVYTVARLRGMENHILDTSFFSRLIDSPNVAEAMKALGETSYAQWLSQADGGFDKAIDAEILATCRELEQFVPDKGLLRIFRMPYDFHNMKVLLKSLFRVRGGDADGRRHELLSNLGTFSVEEMTAAVETEEYGHLPYGLADVVPQCWAAWDQTKSAQAAELLLDHHMFKAMLKEAESLGMKEVTAWVKSRIDAENLRSAVRLARMKYDPARGLPFFHDGGTIRAEDAAKLLGEPMETWGKSLSHLGIGAVLQSLSDQSDMQAAMSDISKSLDEYLIHVLDRVRYSTNSPANVLLYLLVKDAEARNMRIALVCVAGGLNREFARRLLSNVR